MAQQLIQQTMTQPQSNGKKEEEQASAEQPQPSQAPEQQQTPEGIQAFLGQGGQGMT